MFRRSVSRTAWACALAFGVLASAEEAARRIVGGLHARMPSDEFGASACFCGDLDGDGASEIAIGSPGDAGCAGVFIYRGRTGELLRTYWDGSATSDFGAAVCNVGDQDGDGVDDLAVSSTAWPSSGWVEILSGASGVVIARLESERGATSFGGSLERAADVDGDGRSELAISFTRHGHDPFLESQGFAGPSSSCIALFRSRTGACAWINCASEGRRNEARAEEDIDGDSVEDVVIFDADEVRFVSAKDGRRIGTLSLAGYRSVSPRSAWSWRAADGALRTAVVAYERDAFLDSALFVVPELDMARAQKVASPKGVIARTGLVGLGDVDGDGFVEIACATRAPAVVVVSLPSGRVLHETSLAKPEQSQGIAWIESGGDYDGDGVFDLLVRRAEDEYEFKPPVDAGVPAGKMAAFDGPIVISGRTGARLAHFTVSRAKREASR